MIYSLDFGSQWSHLEKNRVDHVKEVNFNTINDIISKRDIVEFFSNYVAWNSIFAGCVTNLVSRFHLWPDIGDDEEFELNEEYLLNISNSIKTKRSHIIAGHIFAAATDEYNDPSIDARVTHKDMAWHFLTSLYELTGKDIKERRVSAYTGVVNKAVLKGYGVNAPINFHNLVRNLGFHIGSEHLASFEFEALNEAMQKHHPELYKQLEDRVLDNGVTGIDWLKVHGALEIEHFNNSIKGVEILVESFKRYKDIPLKIINDGYYEFEFLQSRFIR